MPDTTSTYSSSWFGKLVESLFLYIALSYMVYALGSVTALNIHTRNAESYLTTLFINGYFIFLAIAVGYSAWWHLRERKGKGNSAMQHAWFRGIMRYSLAFEVSTYGFAKILKTQFGVMYSRNDMPIGSLTGFDLTWNYFGYSHTFAVILGLIQIGGSVLLLFRRTTLLGACILLPVMVNVLLINEFYQIGSGPFINSALITAGLLYLLLLRWKDLIAIFITKPSSLPPVRLSLLKPVLKVLMIALAFGVIWSYVAGRKPNPFAGKWVVDELVRNGKPDGKNDWLTKPQSWRNIYFEEPNRILFGLNPYIYEIDRGREGQYQYDAKTHTMMLIFALVDTEKVTISHYTGKSMQWNAILDNDTLQVKLTKEEKTAN